MQFAPRVSSSEVTCVTCGAIDRTDYYTFPAAETNSLGPSLEMASTPEMAHVKGTLKEALETVEALRAKIVVLETQSSDLSKVNDPILKTLTHLATHYLQLQVGIQTLASLTSICGDSIVIPTTSEQGGQVGQSDGDSLSQRATGPSFPSTGGGSSPIPSLVSDSSTSASFRSCREEVEVQERLEALWPEMSSQQINSEQVEVEEVVYGLGGGIGSGDGSGFVPGSFFH